MQTKLANSPPEFEPIEALEFGVGQWLWFHGMTLVVFAHSNIADTQVTASSSRRDEQFLLWLG